MHHSSRPRRLSDIDIAAWLIRAVSGVDEPDPGDVALEGAALSAEQRDGRLTIDTRLVDETWHTVLHYDDGATVWIAMPPG